jgi:hypothetical protein
MSLLDRVRALLGWPLPPRICASSREPEITLLEAQQREIGRRILQAEADVYRPHPRHPEYGSEGRRA